VIGLEIETEFLDDGTRILSIAGEIDLNTAPTFRTELLAAIGSGATVMLDLAGCGFLDCSGLAVLVEAKKRLNGSRQCLTLVVPQPDIIRVFKMTRLDRLFQIHPSRGAAVGGVVV
jgi:anti-sigma B factor antagonist